MDLLNYLTTYSTAFGVPEIIFLIAHTAIVLAGIYYAFIAKYSDPVKAASLRLLGFWLFAFGLVGLLAAVLRLTVGTVFTMPLWFAIITILDLALIGYALYYALSIYPARRATMAASSRNRGASRANGRPQSTLHSSGTNGTPYGGSRPVATTTRRVSRRDRKRKGR
jgi:hypothetical protein